MNNKMDYLDEITHNIDQAHLKIAREDKDISDYRLLSTHPEDYYMLVVLVYDYTKEESHAYSTHLFNSEFSRLFNPIMDLDYKTAYQDFIDRK